jgi:hypothetical protein
VEVHDVEIVVRLPAGSLARTENVDATLYVVVTVSGLVHALNAAPLSEQASVAEASVVWNFMSK